MSANGLIALSMGAIALALLVCAVLVMRKDLYQTRTERTLARAIDERAAQAARRASVPPGGQGSMGDRGLSVRDGVANGTMAGAPGVNAQAAQLGTIAGATQAAATAAALAAENASRVSRVQRLSNALATLGMRWFDTRLGKQLVAAEDQLLIERCGFVDPRARGVFLASRVLCGIGAPLAASFAFGGADSPDAIRVLVYLFVALCLGFMLPKWILGRIAANRRQRVVDELPMLIDLFRLLQGVGLSIDQSIQVVVGDFRRVLPVLAQELEIASRQFVAGRTREQSLQRLATTYDNDDLRAVTRLIIQVDRHGGAVQEPLKQFSDRLREGRRTAMRERIGKLTVKMTTVMITTLLPALLIVTAGPGFLAVIRSLTALAHP